MRPVKILIRLRLHSLSWIFAERKRPQVQFLTLRHKLERVALWLNVLWSVISAIFSSGFVRCYVHIRFSSAVNRAFLYFNPCSPQFLKWSLQTLYQVRTTVPNKELGQKSNQTGKQSRSWWDGSLWAVSSGSTLFAKTLFDLHGCKEMIGYKPFPFVISSNRE